MPFPELTLGFGIAYTFQTGNVEVTPRLDYYYQGETYAGIENIEAMNCLLYTSDAADE